MKMTISIRGTDAVEADARLAARLREAAACADPSELRALLDEITRASVLDYTVAFEDGETLDTAAVRRQEPDGTAPPVDGPAARSGAADAGEG